MFSKIIKHQLSKIAGLGLGGILAAIGGFTSIEWVQPAVEKASDYAASTVRLYCELPSVDRERFRSEVMERLELVAVKTGTTVAEVRVLCPLDPRTISR